MSGYSTARYCCGTTSQVTDLGWARSGRMTRCLPSSAPRHLMRRGIAPFPTRSTGHLDHFALVGSSRCRCLPRHPLPGKLACPPELLSARSVRRLGFRGLDKGQLGGIGSGWDLADDTGDAAKVRADRLRLLREGDHRFFVVVEESVLRNVMGGVEVMAGQLGHLISIASLPSVSLGIIPMGLPRDVMWPVEDFWIFAAAQVNLQLVSALLTLTQPRAFPIYS